MVRLDPDLRRTWLFGPGADRAAHVRMLDSGADALILDLEDFTPPARRGEARDLLDGFVSECRRRQRLAAIRINALETDGLLDLAAAMTARPDVIAYPMSDRAGQMHALDAAISHWENRFDLDQGSTEILPVCETALGVVEVRTMAAVSPRIRCALLGAEDLANDLCAERGADGLELDYARRRFILEARASGIEPIDAPFTFSDVEGAVREATLSRRLGYRSKSLVLPEHAPRLNEVFTPGADEIAHARAIVAGFDAARSRGEDRALVDGLWVEVPTYRNARRLMDRAHRLGVLPGEA
ncbi:HpcH/HpaI aldolase/citrate lyase family protein [Bradyrhizobium sp.]|uniref:HpcH/HpaI aldolase/citrate lyase family protein n=1 Tax=Bradyrhizobium sp. TaxID=376 RepID=UPI0039E3EEE5